MINQDSQFFAILTNVGVAKQANADALGVPWSITHMAVGDANGSDPVPDPAQTTLINERRRAPLNQLKVDAANNAIIIAEQVIPAESGGWWIREVGLYDADGDFVAIANCAPSFKPLLNQGSGRTQVVRINLLVSNSSNVELKIDPSVVLATRKYVDDAIIAVLPPDKKAGTFTRVQINKRGVVIAGDNPTQLADYGILDVYTKTESDAAIKEVRDRLPKQASESRPGILKLATMSLAASGIDDGAAMTAKKTASLFPYRAWVLFESVGVAVWQVPAGVTRVWVRVTGGGGGGGRYSQAGGGGGGGGVAEKLVELKGVTSVKVTVGQGGTGRTGSTGSGLTGGTSSFGSYCSATGGAGASMWCGGKSGLGMGGDVNYSLGNGAHATRHDNGTTLTSIYGGGHGGGSGGIGSGGGALNQPGSSGSLPGSGGGGGNENGDGGSGASGSIEIRW